jgi:hypothetical protein
MKTPQAGGSAAGGHAGAAATRPPGTVRSLASVAAAMQAAIGLLTASRDSPELEARALEARALRALIPHDAEGLGDLTAGLDLISELLIHELHEATGAPPHAILQRLAILAEHRRGMPSAGQGGRTRLRCGQSSPLALFAVARLRP